MCSPSAGGGRLMVSSQSDTIYPPPITVIGRSSPLVPSILCSSLRCLVFGRFRASGTLSTRPAGMPTLLNAASHSAADFSFRQVSISAVSAARFFLRASRSAKRGSVASSGRPMTAGKRHELLLFVGRDVEQPVAREEGAGRRGGEIVVAHRHRLLAGDEIIRKPPSPWWRGWNPASPRR